MKKQIVVSVPWMVLMVALLVIVVVLESLPYIRQVEQNPKEVAENQVDSSVHMTLQSKDQKGKVLLYGYLSVIADELGVYEKEPIAIIQQINEHNSFGLNTWRLPTPDELRLLQYNGYALPNEDYITINFERYNRCLHELDLCTKAYKASVRKFDSTSVVINEPFRPHKYETESGHVILVSDGRFWKNEEEILSEYDVWRKKYYEKLEENHRIVHL